jgi:uncharacterized protein YbcI
MPEERLHGGELAAAISTLTVRAVANHTGRGPTKARTTIADDAIFVVLEDTLTKGERTLVEHGDHDAVLGLRKKWQNAMRTDLACSIEELTGREVIGFMSDNHIDPDLGVEVFVLLKQPEGHDEPSRDIAATVGAPTRLSTRPA